MTTIRLISAEHGALTARVFLEDGEKAVCVEVTNGEQVPINAFRLETACIVEALRELASLSSLLEITSGIVELTRVVRVELLDLSEHLQHGPDISLGWAGSRSERRLRQVVA